MLYEDLAPGAQKSFTWDGHLVEFIDDEAMHCPYGGLTLGCNQYCTRTIDATPGTYGIYVDVRLNEYEGLSINDWFEYPANTDVLVVIQ